MLSPTGWYVAVAPIDLRCGVDRLLVKVQAELGRDVRDGGAYVFRNRSATRIKLLCVDAQGVWLCVRRLHEGLFVWPRANDALCALVICRIDNAVTAVNAIDNREPRLKPFPTADDDA